VSVQSAIKEWGVSAGRRIRTPERLRDETLNLTPLARLGYPCMRCGEGTSPLSTNTLPISRNGRAMDM
jgi:hypothetical protein